MEESTDYKIRIYVVKTGRGFRRSANLVAPKTNKNEYMLQEQFQLSKGRVEVGDTVGDTVEGDPGLQLQVEARKSPRYLLRLP